MRNFISTIKTNGEMNANEAATAFGWSVIERAYNAGRVSFEGEMIVFIQ